MEKNNNMPQNKKNNNMAGKNMKKKNSNSKWIFLGSVIFIYLITIFINSDNTLKALVYSWKLLLTVLPILLVVLVFMFFFNLINEEKFKAFIEKSPKHMQYLVMSVFGTLSHGPIYAWYPLMKDLRLKGVTNGSIASFLYARGIKITLLPMLVIYFGLKFAIVLTILLFIFSYMQGILVDLLMQKKVKN